jgi:hypothetical protein
MRQRFENIIHAAVFGHCRQNYNNNNKEKEMRDPANRFEYVDEFPEPEVKQEGYADE